MFDDLHRVYRVMQPAGCVCYAAILTHADAVYMCVSVFCANSRAAKVIPDYNRAQCARASDYNKMLLMFKHV